MAKRSLVWIVALFCLAAVARAGQDKMTTPGSWSGIIINSGCTSEQAFAEAEECTRSTPGGTLSFYDDTTRQIFSLDPQGPAAGHVGDPVAVHGNLDGTTLHLTALEVVTSYGLEVGRKAPDFSARDQFGHEQTLDTLKGPNGTALLFFRSADW